MKKYALLILLFCATAVLGGMVYHTAHKQAVAASTQNISDVMQPEVLVEEEILREKTKELARQGGKSAARFLFSLIYK